MTERKHLEDGRAGDDGVVACLCGVLRQDGVRLPVDARRDLVDDQVGAAGCGGDDELSGNVSVGLERMWRSRRRHRRRRDRGRRGRGMAYRLKAGEKGDEYWGAVGLRVQLSRLCKGHWAHSALEMLSALEPSVSAGPCMRWISESSVESNSLGASDGQRREGREGQRRVLWRKAGDESRRQREDLVEGQGRVERLRERRLVQMCSDEGRMARLDGQDAAGSGEGALFENRRGRSEVTSGYG